MYKNKCKYCNREFESNDWRSFWNHVGNCKMNPNFWEGIKKMKMKVKNKKIYKKFKCPKCGKTFTLHLTKHQIKNKNHKTFCTYKCSNSRKQSVESNRKRRDKLSGKKKETKQKLVENTCGICGKKFLTLPSKKTKTCGNKKCISKQLSLNRKGKKYEEIFGKEKGAKLRKQRRYNLIKYIKTKCNNITPMLGKHEKEILDKLEIKIRYKIIRQYYIKNLHYWTDGYCKELNLVIEVDEMPKIKEKDIRRENEIKKELKCEFIRIRDY